MLTKASDLFQKSEDYLADIPVVAQLADMLNVRPIYFPIGLLALLLLLMGKMEDIILGIVGFFYPAWQSFKVIETRDLEKSQQWLAYWVVYAFFSFVEIFSDVLLFWIPFYYVLKLGFLLWLFMPQYQGASTIYASIVRPLLAQHQDKIDRVIGQVTKLRVPTNLQEAEEVDQTVRRRR